MVQSAMNTIMVWVCVCVCVGSRKGCLGLKRSNEEHMLLILLLWGGCGGATGGILAVKLTSAWSNVLCLLDPQPFT